MSREYLRQSAFIIDEHARFCEQQEPAHPWLLRCEYLVQRVELRANRSFSASYLDSRTRQLRHFLRWYLARLEAGQVPWGEPSPKQLAAYWSVQPQAAPYRHRILAFHLRPLLQWLQQRPPIRSSGEIDALVSDYLRKHYLAVRGNGYGVVLTHRAKIVTRRHLVWLEQHGLLPTGTAAQGASWSDSASPPATVAEDSRALTARHGKSESQALLDYVLVRVDSELPPPLRQPLLDYLEHLAGDRELARSSIEASLRTNVALVRKMAAAGHGSFTQLRVSQLDEVVSSLLRSPPPELIHRRQQVRAHHSRPRGFLRYLYRRRLLDRDLASALISPPCYRASTPVTVLSEQQLQQLLRQGEALSTIQEVLGHRTAETTQRYAATDLEMLRQVLEEIER